MRLAMRGVAPLSGKTRSVQRRRIGNVRSSQLDRLFTRSRCAYTSICRLRAGPLALPVGLAMGCGYLFFDVASLPPMRTCRRRIPCRCRGDNDDGGGLCFGSTACIPCDRARGRQRTWQKRLRRSWRKGLRRHPTGSTVYPSSAKASRPTGRTSLTMLQRS